MYGSHAYGSAALGGIPASQGLFFYPFEPLDTGTYRRTREYLGEAQFFAVETRATFESDDPVRSMKIYSHNDPFETPQLQVTVGIECFYTQSIIGAARFIVVEVTVTANVSQLDVTITGNEYFQ